VLCLSTFVVNGNYFFEETKPGRCCRILVLLRKAANIFVNETAEDKAKTVKIMVSTGWCKGPHGKAKRDFYQDRDAIPITFTIWRHSLVTTFTCLESKCNVSAIRPRTARKLKDHITEGIGIVNSASLQNFRERLWRCIESHVGPCHLERARHGY
jgi:hypothetical protein